MAAHAGVSASTVSYVMSGKRSISQTTTDRVMRAVVELGYHPRASARALASNRTNVIALMVPLRSDMYVPVIMEIVMAAATTAREHGQDILLLTGGEGPDGVRRIAASGIADAIILMDVELDDQRIPVLREAAMPAVLIGLPSDTAGLTCVDLDFQATGAACVDHLADLGHRDIALIGESKSVYRRHTGFAARTLDGFQRQAHERRLRAVHRPCEGTFEATAGVLTRILDERPTTSGFVVQNEAAIRPTLDLLRQFGRVVPEDVSVVAICPDQLALQLSPQLTSVSIPAEEMGRSAVDLVMAQLSDRPSGGTTTLIPPMLNVRDSSAAVR
ncbi:LacI family DNA-binding transcriptional regulator [Amycolatopsis sp. NPDC049253]|uniref:LacI family DNA-binding transcriptional regulator n=1 Tax=Amycolatopsis sp. NPDC049253 TaxID=3155274 RepID=UPI003448F5BE